MIARTDGTISRRRLYPAARLGLCLGVACSFLLSAGTGAAQPAGMPTPGPVIKQISFKTPEAACEALAAAAEKYDVASLKAILGPDGLDLVVTEDSVHDKNQSAAFAAQARLKTRVARDAAAPGTAVMLIGADEWPMPIPVVEEKGQWRFDAKAGREEVLFRRIGANELDAIQVCRGYVEAQHEYALEKRDGARVNQYAQHVISTPGKQDGLAWQAPDGSWQGPVGEHIAEAIDEGYADRYHPYHGYFFKVLKRQGPAAPMGEMDYVVEGAMIGGFALVAAPAEYEVTGVKTFMVSHDGVVYEKDLGPTTVEQFRAMERFDPDPSWSPVEEPPVE
jgi:hypothetical protein